MKNPNELMSRIRARLLLKEPFFGSLAMRLQMIEDNSPLCDTMMTNAIDIRWNRKFVESMTEAEQWGVLAHEVLHCALAHPHRRNNRDPRYWNLACDFAINPMLLDAGFKLPGQPINFSTPDGVKGYLFDIQYKGMTAEQIYSKLPKKPQAPGGAGGSGGVKPQPGKGKGAQAPGKGEPPQPGDITTGSFGDAPTGKDVEADEMTEHDWQMAAEQAARVALAAGKLPLGADRLLQQSREPKIDWKTELRRFLTNQVPYDYSFNRPNRRFISQGIYLPGAVKENVGKIVVAIDTSGSVTQQMLEQFAAEMTAILTEAHPSEIVVIYCDAEVNGTETFTPNDGAVKLKMKGGGGTMFKPVFNWVEKNNTHPVALIYMTDLESSDTPKEPEYPTLWVTPEWVSAKGPFGETLRIAGL